MSSSQAIKEESCEWWLTYLVCAVPPTASHPPALKFLTIFSCSFIKTRAFRAIIIHSTLFFLSSVFMKKQICLFHNFLRCYYYYCFVHRQRVTSSYYYSYYGIFARTKNYLGFLKKNTCVVESFHSCLKTHSFHTHTKISKFYKLLYFFAYYTLYKFSKITQTLCEKIYATWFFEYNCFFTSFWVSL